MKKYLVLLCLVFVSRLTFGQQFNYWPLSNTSALNFNTEPPFMDTCNNSLSQTSSSICDSSGKLLFYGIGYYTDTSLLNRKHHAMPHSYLVQQSNDPSGFKNVFIIPKNKNEYYFFYLGYEYVNGAGIGTAGLRYVTIDMRLDGGLGDVEVDPRASYRRDSLSMTLVDTTFLQGFTAVRQSGLNFWLIGRYGDSIYAYPVSPTGVGARTISDAPECAMFPHRVFDKFGTNIYTFGNSNNNNNILEHSNDGSFLVSISNGSRTFRFDPNSFKDKLPLYSCVYVYDFDKSTGKVSNGRPIENTQINYALTPSGQTVFGPAAFSPNDSLFYVITYPYIQVPLDTVMLQFQRFAPNISKSAFAIINSQTGLRDLQLGPDGKIYVASSGSGYLPCIYRPNKYGNSCDFENFKNAIPLERGNAIYFPNVLYEFHPVGYKPNVACNGMVNFMNTSDKEFTSAAWYFSDLTGKKFDSLFSYNASYWFSKPGKYFVKLAAITPAGYRQWFSDSVTVSDSVFLKADYGFTDTAGCQWAGFNFYDSSYSQTVASPGPSWYWDFGDGSAPLTYTKTKRPVVSYVYTQSGTYTVKLVYGNGLCTDTFVSQKKVVIIPAPKPGFTISDKVGNFLKVDNFQSGLDTLVGCVSMDVTVTDGSVGAVDKWVYTVRETHPLPPPAGDSIKSPSFSYSFSKPGMYMVHQYLTGSTGCITEDSVLINATPVFNASEKADMFYVTVDTDLSVQGGNTIEAYWFAFPGAFNYALYRFADNDSANTILLTQTDQTSFLDINADPAHHSYTYYIEAQDGCGHFTSRGRIGKTIKLSGFENGNLLPQLAWTAYKDWSGWPNNYEILRQDPGASYKNIGSTNDTSYQDTALTARDVYRECYRVRTLWNDTSPVSYSNVFCFGNTPQIYIPNIFTPDANNLNDVFAPVCDGIKSYSMTIINRCGEKVFTSQSSPSSPSPLGEGRGEAGWDGSFKGITSPNGIYIYFIKAVDFNGNTITRKGMVMLQQ